MDAKRLMSSGDYLTTLDGNIIEQGQVLESRDSLKILYRVTALHPASNSVTLERVIKPRHGSAFSEQGIKVATSKLGAYQPVDLSQEKIDELVLSEGRWGYSDLATLRVDDAFLRDNAERLLNQMSSSQVILSDDDGELVATARSEALELVRAGYRISRPRVSDSAWRQRALGALFRLRREVPNYARRSIEVFAEALLGKEWLPEATQAFGNPATDAAMSGAIEEEISRLWEAYQERKTERLGPVGIEVQQNPGRLDALSLRSLSHGVIGPYDRYSMARTLRARADSSLTEAGYDVDAAALNDMAGHQAEALHQRMDSDLEEALGRLKALAEKAKDAAAAEAAERAQAVEAAMPEGIRSFFGELGIQAKLNADTITWQPKGGGRRRVRAPETTSPPGDRFMLFDPKGRGGALASNLAGNKALQSRYNITWSIFDGDLWWHLPTEGLDYTEFMEAFQ